MAAGRRRLTEHEEAQPREGRARLHHHQWRFVMARCRGLVGERALVSLVAVWLVALSLTGCSSTTLRMAGQRMCASGGGTYNVKMQHCTDPNQRQPAKESCVAEGGYYDEAADVCEIGID